MKHRLTLSTSELIVIRDAIHTLTIRAIDSPIVGALLTKVYSEIDKADRDRDKNSEEKV